MRTTGSARSATDPIGCPPYVDNRGSGDRPLIAGELLADAVRFCQRDVLVEIDGHRDCVRVSVTDDALQPAARRQPALESTAGRGPPVVATVAERWGQRPHDGRTKDVWADIAVPATSPLSLRCRR